MLKTYKARLTNNRLEWLDTPPPNNGGRELLVDVSISLADCSQQTEKSSVKAIAALRELAERGGLSMPEKSTEPKSGAKMVEALELLAKIGGLQDVIPDPVAWQREIRQDRTLPGRD